MCFTDRTCQFKFPSKRKRITEGKYIDDPGSRLNEIHKFKKRPLRGIE
jgi:hypothetical protein